MNNILDIKTPAQSEAAALKSDYGLINHGIENLRMAYWNLPTEALYRGDIVSARSKDLTSRTDRREHGKAYCPVRQRQIHR